MTTRSPKSHFWHSTTVLVYISHLNSLVASNWNDDGYNCVVSGRWDEIHRNSRWNYANKDHRILCKSHLRIPGGFALYINYVEFGRDLRVQRMAFNSVGVGKCNFPIVGRVSAHRCRRSFHFQIARANSRGIGIGVRGAGTSFGIVPLVYFNQTGAGFHHRLWGACSSWDCV